MTGGGPVREASHGFDFLTDPVLVVTLKGCILDANSSARTFFGSKLSGGRLSGITADDGEACVRYLRRASGSTGPRPGRLSFVGEKGSQDFMTQAARSQQDISEGPVILRLLPPASDRFAMLDRRVKDLDAKLHKRHQENVALQEALRQNRTLLRELQHRVKNNIQLMMSLIKMSAQGYSTEEVAAVVKASRGRLQAMAAAQESLYQAEEVDKVLARGFLEDVVRTTARANDASGAVSLSLDDAELSSEEAHCLALIANELITNAAKYGLREGRGRIAVTFADDGEQYRFEVVDDGMGILAEAATRSSGLALVRGLCRQIGGRLEIDGSNGTRCTVQFRADKQGKKTT